MSTRDDDFAAEVRAHLEHEADELIADGAAASEAKLAARRAFGSVAAAQEQFYESHRWLWLDHLQQDLRDAMRSLMRYPIASTVAILSIAAGIGVTAATLTIRDVIFRNPPPSYRDPASLSEVRVARGSQPIRSIGSYPPGGLAAVWIDALGPSVAAAVAPPQGVRDVRFDDRTEPTMVRAVTPELFDMLGVRAIAGQTFAAASNAGDQAPPVLLSDRLWDTWFERRGDAIGRTILIDNRPQTIVGVLPRRFWISAWQPAVWTILDRASLASQAGVEVIIRRPPGMTPTALQNILEPLMARYAAQQPADQRELHLMVAPVVGTPMAKQMSIALPWVLGIASMLTLLIACANVAILMIARWTSREHEISIRASLGASRGRLVRALLTESIVIALSGGTLSIAAGLALLKIVLLRAGGEPEFIDPTIHAGVFLQSGALTLAAGVLVGLAPALLETRRLGGNPMRSNALIEPLRQRWRHALVVLEIAVTIALLVVAVTFINSFRRVATAEMGFDTRPLLSTRVENPAGVPVDTILDTLRGVGGIAEVAASTTVPFTVSGPRTHVAIDGADAAAVNAERAAITPSFFATLDLPVRSGRGFTSRDTDKSRVAIVNEALSRKLFGAADRQAAVGRRIRFDGATYDIVGVVANFSNRSFFVEPDPRVFMPLALDPKAQTRATFVVRAKDDPAPLVPTVRRAIRDGAPGTTVTSTFTFETIKIVSSEEIILGTAPLLPLILIGLLLTTAGIYGVLAFAITRRARELAVRVAIGATSRDLAGLVAAHSARLFLIGMTVGIGFTFALTRIVRASGGGGSPFDSDWTAFAIPTVIVAAVVALATWLPSRRVRKIDPAVLLREG
jgi:putative ABC transport system permease protein